MAQIRKIQMGALIDAGTAIPTWAYDVGGYAGSWLGGLGVGYVVAKSGKGAITGGLTTSAMWSAATGIRNYETNHPAVTAGLFGISALSLYLAWTRS